MHRKWGLSLTVMERESDRVLTSVILLEGGNGKGERKALLMIVGQSKHPIPATPPFRPLKLRGLAKKSIALIQIMN